jgi:hypothetical protein
MGNKTLTVTVIISIVLALFIGCNSDSPQNIAKKFWSAVADEDIETAKSYATRATANAIQHNEGGGTLEVTFGEITTDGWQTTIDTAAHTVSGDSEETMYLKTVLVQEDGQWRVDAIKTMMSALGVEVAEAMQGAVEMMQGEEFTELMQGMAEGMAEVMEKSMESMGK